MTDPIVGLEPSRIRASPGGQASTVITVRNQGRIVDGFHLRVLGDGPPSWGRVEPEELRILPGEQATATVTFAPPAGSKSVSGSYPFGILASSTVDPTTSAAVEGDLEVDSVYGLQAKLSPVSSTGRWRGRHLVEVTNWGNTSVQLQLTAADPDNQLGFLFVPAAVEVPVGSAAVSRLHVRTRHPRLRGSITRLPFHVVASPEDAPDDDGPPSPVGTPRTAMVDGAFTQRPILSRLIVVLISLVLVAAIGAIAFALRQKPPAPIALTASGPPNTPGLTVAAADSGSLTLTWPGQPNIKSYNLVEISAGGAFLTPTALDGAQTGITVGKLQPNSHHCFRMQAIRGDFSSLYSEPRCATTPAAPATPTAGAAAGSVGSSTRSTNASTAPTSAPPATTSSTSIAGQVVIPPGSVHGSTSTSVSSGPVSSGSTPPPTAATSVSTSSVSTPITPITGQPDGVFTPAQYIAVYASPFLPPDAANTASANKLKATLPAGNAKAGVVLSSKYSHFTVAGIEVKTASLWIYLGPYPSASDAAAVCGQHLTDWPQGCLVAHPGALSGH